MTNSKRPHHHGNLREALIVAGLDLMEQGAPDALTLRKCAKRAGVSHAAPAHHFNGLISLQGAIIARGHQLFAQSMKDACTQDALQADATPHTQLRAICDGYINFARSHSAVFKLMFQQHGLDKSTLDDTSRNELIRDATASYQVLRDACAPFESNGTDTEIMVWSLVHGYAMLFCGITSPLHPSDSAPDFSQILPNLKLKTGPDTEI